MGIPEINPAETIIFRASIADDLNCLVAKIDPRLFFSVYYQPKSWREDESARYNFRNMIINLYGLFHDCGNFTWTIANVLIPTVKQYLNHPMSSTILSPDDQSALCQSDMEHKFSALIVVIDAWRSVFCHNNDDQQKLNLGSTEIALNWCEPVVPFISMNVAMDTFDDILEEDWIQLSEKLLGETCDVFWYLKKCFTVAASMPSNDFAKKRIVEKWLSNLSHWYSKKQDLLLNWVADWYGYYINTVRKGVDAGVYDEKKSFRKNTENWAKNTFGNPYDPWATPWLTPRGGTNPILNILYSNSCPCPATPDAVFGLLARNVRDYAVKNRL